MPVPRVSVRNSVRNPIRPRAGTRYSIRTQPVPWLTICSIRPLRSASSCVTDADVLLRNVDRHPLDRLGAHAVDLASDDLRLADGQLESLAPHQLDEHGQRELAAALDLPDVGAVGLVDAQRDVADQLAVEPRLDLAGGEVLTVLAGSGEELIPIVTDSDGSSTMMIGSGRGSSASVSVSPIVISGMPGDRDDLAR